MRNENNFEFLVFFLLICYGIHKGHAKNDPITAKNIKHVDLTISYASESLTLKSMIHIN